MARKNKRLPTDTALAPIKESEDRRDTPVCPKYPRMTVFTTGWRAQTAIDEIAARSDRQRKPTVVRECLVTDGGCGFFHLASQESRF